MKSEHLSKQVTDAVFASKSGHLEKVDPKLLDFQAYFLAHRDNENQNVFHKACLKGNLELLDFIHEKAGPSYLNILEEVVDHKDLDGLTPIYYLCMRGYNQKSDI